MSYILKTKELKLEKYPEDVYRLFLDLPTFGYYLGKHNLLTIDEYNDYGQETLSEDDGGFVYFGEWADCANRSNYKGIEISFEIADFIIRNAIIKYDEPLCIKKFDLSGNKVED